MRVYKHYDQEQLNCQYNIRQFVPNYAAYFENWEKKSAQVKKNIKIGKIFFTGVIQKNASIFFRLKNLMRKH